MLTQKDLQDVVNAVNEVLKQLDNRLSKLEQAAAKPSTPVRNTKKV